MNETLKTVLTIAIPFVVGAAIAVVICWLGFIRPSNIALADLRREGKELRSQIESSLALNKELGNKLGSANSELQRTKSSLQLAVANAADIAARLARINANYLETSRQLAELRRLIDESNLTTGPDTETLRQLGELLSSALDEVRRLSAGQ